MHQLKELGVDQAALVGEPDHLVYGLSMIFTSSVERVKAWFEKDIASENERIRWIKNDKLPHPDLNSGTTFMHSNLMRIVLK